MAPKVEANRVWMMDGPGYVDVTDHYLWIWFGRGHQKLEFHINGRRLWEQLKSATDGKVIPVGDLDILPKMDKGVMMLNVFNAEEFEQEIPYGFQVTLFCLREALVPFLKFC